MLAEHFGTDIYGVKGYSILHNFMSIPDGCLVDYMHCILQGTGKWLISAMLNPNNKEKPFYIGSAKQRTINQMLVTVHVPHDMDRKPRSLEYLKYWKATEIQHFLLYYGLPLLKKKLDDQYFHHLALLTTALWIFLKNEISEDEINLAGKLLRSFCRLMKPLYGERSETINAHCLTHLEDQVRTLGPLWTHSAFAFEATIAHTLKGFKGTRGVAQQMVTNYLVDKEVGKITQTLHNSEASKEVKDFSEGLSLSKAKADWNFISKTVSFPSQTSKREITDEEASAINRLLASNDLPLLSDSEKECSTFAERCKKGENVFHSTSYRRRGKSCSYIVQFYISDDEEYCYGEVQTYLHLRCFPLAIIKPFTSFVTTICNYDTHVPNDLVVKRFSQARLLGSHHIPVIGPPESALSVIRCDDITAKCIFVKVKENDDDDVFGYVTPLTDFNCQ